ncbi:MAG: hypothetical protein N3G80_04420 [Candidatus Micrarchaeota archaeon]|nr:hypothetical protein [Candidatus Micrarchaeota archaeon]
MPSGDKANLMAKAALLEKKQLFIRAAEIYLSCGMEQEAACAYEKGGSFEKAAKIYEKLGKTEEAKRCRLKLEAQLSGQSWQDLQAEFQKEKGNPL